MFIYFLIGALIFLFWLCPHFGYIFKDILDVVCACMLLYMMTQFSNSISFNIPEHSMQVCR